jgi:heme exporter protein B
MEIEPLAWTSRVFWVIQKDLKSEFRTRYSINTIFMFALVTLSVISFSVGQFSLDNRLKASLLWIVIFFSSMAGLAQIFVKEEESNTSNALKLVADSNIIFVGKFLFNLILILLLEVIIVPLFIIFVDLTISNSLIFLTVLFLSSFGLACSTTIIAAVVAKTNVKGALFAVLSFPILLPLLVVAVKGTQVALLNGNWLSAWNQYIVLFSYAVVMLTLSILLFEFVWEE